nr:unnamed protein product [Callosobruchus analis]
MPKVVEGGVYEKKYFEDDLQKALVAVRHGMPKRRAAAEFGIPRQTLQFRLSQNFSKTDPGPTPILTFEEESLLVKWIFECQRKGFLRRKEDIQLSVKQFLEKNPRKIPFKDNLSYEGWYKAFLRRHSEIALRTSEGVTAASGNVSGENIREEGYMEILNDPSRVFNADESGFQLCPKTKKVLAPRGAKNIYEVDVGQAKASITVLFTFAAAGNITPTMIVYPYKRLPSDIVNSIPDPSWGVAHSDLGWMKSEIFYEYMANVLRSHLKKAGVKFPVILFLDGHKSHLDRNLRDLCTKLEIILISLYPNATRVLQPADVSAFRPLKQGWRKGVLDWRRDNSNSELTKQNFATILRKVIQNLEKNKANVSNGFRACRLYPWNAEAVDFTKCLGKSKIAKQCNDEAKKVSVSDLKYDKFIEIVGDEYIKKFIDFQNFAGHNTDGFIKLYKVWQEFQKHDDGYITPTEADITAYRVHDVNDIIIEEICGPSITDNSIKPTADICSSVSNATALSDDCQNASAQPLEDILLWPSSPVRKGKRKTERLPFVITSSAWKEVFKAKEEKKETERKQKEERKILRQLNKEAKEKATNNKGVSNKKGLKRKVELISSIVVRPPDSGQSVWADDSDCSDPHCKHTLKHGICFTCTFGISKSLCGVKCIKCARSYHVKCLEKYLVKLDEDPFICKVCQQRINK